MRRHIFRAALLCALLVFAACRQTEPPQASSTDLVIALTVDPQPPTTGASTLNVTLKYADGNPVTGAQVAARGDMSHAGMTPVIAEAQAGDGGDYSILFEWTMAGDWFVDITVTLPDGREFQQRFDLSVSGEMSMNAHDDAAHHDTSMSEEPHDAHH